MRGQCTSKARSRTCDADSITIKRCVLTARSVRVSAIVCTQCHPLLLPSSLLTFQARRSLAMSSNTQATDASNIEIALSVIHAYRTPPVAHRLSINSSATIGDLYDAVSRE